MSLSEQQKVEEMHEGLKISNDQLNKTLDELNLKLKEVYIFTHFLHKIQ